MQGHKATLVKYPVAVLLWQLIVEQSADAACFSEADAITSLSLPKWSEGLIKAFSLVKKRGLPALLLVSCVWEEEGQRGE